MPMSRRFDVFMFNYELDVLEMRLTELQEVDNLQHVLIEATLDHQGHEKPLYYDDNRSRFAAWNHRIVHVIAGSLPTAEQNPDPWSREHGQREHGRLGLVDAEPDDVVMHGDLDEIPRAWVAAVDPGQVVLGTNMRDHAFAVDWLGPEWFKGTVLTKYRNIISFTALRYMRNSVPVLADAGWHINSLGGPEGIRRKLQSFCHLEMLDMLLEGVDNGWFYERGYKWGPPPDLKLGEMKLKAVDVDDSWPRYIRERKCPESWFRPRSVDEKGEANAV